MSAEGIIPDDADLKVGEKVGEYVIERKLGTGSFGSVYGAIQPLIGKQVAVKVLSRKYSADPSVVSRFIAEARAVNQIRHKNIIDIFSFGQLEDGRHFHVMELLEGNTLDEFAASRGGRLQLEELTLVMRGLARALDAAHASGIAHRDLKPANVFLGRDEEGRPFPKLLDFGIAKLLTDELPKQHSTATGAAVGTPDYMSPEQCQGPNVDHKTDIYSFGVMTFQLLTGHLPFKGANVVELLMKHMTAEAPKPSSVAPDVDPALDEPVLAMLAKKPADRPLSCRAAVQSFEDAASKAGYTLPPSNASGEISGPLPAISTRTPLSEPAFAATIPSSGSDELQAPSSNAKPIAIGVALVLLVVVALPFLLDAKQPTTPPPPPPPPVVAPPPPVVEIAKNVVLMFSGGPPGAEIIADGKVLGTTPGPIEVERSEATLELTFRAEGFEDGTQSIVPSENATVAVSMTKIAETPPPTKKPIRRPTKTKRPTGKKDPRDPDSTERPDW